MKRALGFVVVATAMSLAIAADPAKPAAAQPVAEMTTAQRMEVEQAYIKALDGKQGIKSLPSGLRIKIEREGSGANPSAADTVKVNYRGTLTDGKEFDSSYKRGQAATFPLGGVIPCWTEGLQLLKAGGKATLYCPPGIAYGAPGHPPVIPESATLVFEVELLEVVGAKTPAAAKKEAP